jgi:hypothetical protein
MEGAINRAIGLWESWHQKQSMLESVFGSGIAGELDKEKLQFLSAGIARITPGASADEKLVLAMLKKTAARLEKQLYPNPVLRVLRRLKSLMYDRPIQVARLKQLKADNISSLSRDLSSVGIDADKLGLDRKLDFESPVVDMKIASPYGTDHNFKVNLHLMKDQTGAYELKGYTAELKDTVNPQNSRSYRFDAELGINTREAANLLQGRAVLKHYQMGANRMASKWIQLDFKQLTPEGKPLLKEMGADYEFNIRQQITSIASALEKWDLTSSRVLDGLEKGNQIVLKQVTGETAYLEANAIDKQVLIRDSRQKPVKLESLAAERKPPAEKRTKELKLTKARNVKQGQSLAVS